MRKNADLGGVAEEWERLWKLSKDKWFRHPRYQETIARILKDRLAGRIVLDIGCGTGDYLSRLEGACIPVGLDISAGALRLARGHRVVASAECLPFKTGSLGGIFSIGTFHCLPHPGEMLKEAHRVLAADGLLILIVPSATSLPALIKRFLDPLFRFVFRMLENDRMPDIHRTYSLRALGEMVTRSGYAVLEHHRVHIGYAFRSPLIRLPLTAIEKLCLRRMAEEIVVVCARTACTPRTRD